MFWHLIFILNIAFVISENVLMTEVFEIVINPGMFNWTHEDIKDQFVYQPSLLNSPDLPSWIHYRYSSIRQIGYLYGVPPNKHNLEITLEIIALNRKDYETRRHVIPIRVSEKLNPARHEVQLKIDNLNVEDMFEVKKMNLLKDVFKNHLWKDSGDDLYVTFLASAIDTGARLPVDPNEREGVVLWLGSRVQFSAELIELQEEVRPLRKIPSCPRGFKKTKVEKYFKKDDFIIDWCSFRLLENNNGVTHQSQMNVEKLSNIEDSSSNRDRWESVTKEEVPQRSYSGEFALTLLLPMFILLLLTLILSTILCFHHEGIKDEDEEFFDNIFHICVDYIRSKQFDDVPKGEINQYATIHRATQSLRSLSNTRDISNLSPEMISNQSHTNSPTSTISRGVHCRPSPPPYIRPKFKPEI